MVGFVVVRDLHFCLLVSRRPLAATDWEAEMAAAPLSFTSTALRKAAALNPTTAQQLALFRLLRALKTMHYTL